MCVGVKGFLSKIVEVMKKESGASTFRFYSVEFLPIIPIFSSNAVLMIDVYTLHTYIYSQAGC